MDITVTIPDEGVKILNSWLGVGEIQAWVQHAINNKLRKRIDASILEETDKNPQKLEQDAKLLILKAVVLPTKEERDRLEYGKAV